MPKTTRDLSQFAQEKRDEGGFVVPWGDKELTVPSPAFWPAKAREAASKGESAESLRIIAGKNEFDAFVKHTGEDPEVIANLIWELMVEELGIPLGGASPSSTS